MRYVTKWNSLPGNFDRLNLFRVFASDNEYGIPTIKGSNRIPEKLTPYNARKTKAGECVHFFLDDFRFEPVWNKPLNTLSVIQRAGMALSPDFSIYTDYPLALQIYNVYRNRWMGAFWESEGIEVIPTIGWGDEKSFDFCFLGVEKGSIVAISSVGIKTKEQWDAFYKGYDAMCKIIEPSKILVYGENFKTSDSKVIVYPTRWQEIRRELNERSDNQ